MNRTITLFISLIFLLMPLAQAQAKTHRYLSIDAGGMLGLIPAEVLATIEHVTRKPIYQLVDGVIGTSTGSIIASLLLTPQYNNRKPYTAREIAEVYTSHGAELFQTIFKSYVQNGFREMADLETDYTEIHEAYDSSAAKLIPNISLCNSKQRLMILSLDSDSFKHHIFDSLDYGACSLPIRKAVKASISISKAFGPSEVVFPDRTKRHFIDAGYSENGNDPIYDPTPYLYQKLLRQLASGDRAVIYSLGTGYDKMSQKTAKLIKQQNTQYNPKVKIIRIEPEVDQHLGVSFGTVSFPFKLKPPRWLLRLFAADTSPETVEKLIGEAKRLTKTKAYEEMLFDLVNHARKI